MREDLPSRLTGVLAVLYLMYNEGYLSRGSDAAVRDDLCLEAIRLSRMLAQLAPNDGEVRGLVALLLLTQARRSSRIDGNGLVLFEDQDRERWDRALLVEGLDAASGLLDRSEGGLGQYQLLALIAATHAASPTAAEVDWETVLGLYDALMATAPTAVVALNRSIAVSHVRGARAALDEVELLDLDNYLPFHITRAHLFEQLGARGDARDALACALTYATNPLERAHLEQRLAELTD
jgi:RNA polymerase sigma-70 factor (ECF subfamily)